MTPAAVLAAAVTSAAVVAVWARRHIREEAALAQHYLDLFTVAEAQCNRLIAERRKAEQVPAAMVAVYQRQVRELSRKLDTAERLIRVLDCAVMHPTNRREQ